MSTELFNELVNLITIAIPIGVLIACFIASASKEKSYAVVFTYSFDDDSATYLFETEEDAEKFLKDSYESELSVGIDENGWWNTYGDLMDGGRYARIVSEFADHEYVTEIHLSNVYA